MTAERQTATKAGRGRAGNIAHRTARKPEPAPAPSGAIDIERGAEAWLAGLTARGKAAPFAAVFDITLARARAMLARNAGNRKVRVNHVTRLREEIDEGRWRLNGETLVISDDGYLNDGQHRLHAVIAAARPIRTVLVFGATRESRFTLDLGAPRQPADVLHFMGHRNATVLASAARLVIAWERGGGVNLNWLRSSSRTAVVERAGADEKLQDAVRWACHELHIIGKLIPPSPLSMVRYLLLQVDPDKAEAYLRGLVEGTHLGAHAPALSVRRYLHSVDNRNREAIVALILRGWVLFAQGRSAEPGQLHGRMPLPGIGLVPATPRE